MNDVNGSTDMEPEVSGETLADSPSENNSSTEDSTFVPDDSSSEDVNTPSGNDDVEETDKPVGIKGQNRFQKLSEENRKLSRREEYEQAKINARNSVQQRPIMGQPIMAPGYNPLAAQLELQKIELEDMREQREFDQAVRSHPELDESSPDYDRDLHDITWNIRATEGLTYAQAAAKAKAWRDGQVNKIASKVRAEAEAGIESKTGNSTKSQRRTAVSGTQEADQVKSAHERFRSTGSVEDLAAYKAMRRRNG